MKHLVATLALFVAACGSKAGPSTSPSSSAAAAPSASASASGRSSFEVLRIADDVDAFPPDTTDLPKGGSLLTESVPAGRERRVIPKELVDQICDKEIEGQPPIHCEKVGDQMAVEVPVGVSRSFLRVVALEGESLDDTRARVLAFAKTRKLPEGTRIVLGRFSELDEATKKNVPVGFRTYVVRGDAILTEKDIDSAKAVDNDGAAAVVVSLTPDAATRFEKLTEDNVMRRLGLVIDGVVLSAPVVQAKISGGHLSISMSSAEKSSPAEKDEAERLAKALSGH